MESIISPFGDTISYTVLSDFYTVQLLLVTRNFFDQI